MKRLWVKIAGAVLLLLLIAQFIQPEMPPPTPPKGQAAWDNPEMDPRVAATFKRACADCHSNDTLWPWYVRISPGSWFMVSHVKEGRKKLNFSVAPVIRDETKGDISDEIRDGGMPLKSYLILHPNARLSEQDRKLILEWATK